MKRDMKSAAEVARLVLEESLEKDRVSISLSLLRDLTLIAENAAWDEHEDPMNTKKRKTL